jgi:regulator of cell morphogenesis and NO signaling
MNITPDTRVAEIAARNPATIRVFQRLAIDFCCGGKRPLSEVCAEKHMTFGEMRAVLESAGRSGGTDMPAADTSLAELVSFIVDRYHADLRTELPRLSQMAAKVLNAHGAKHPDLLAPLEETFRELRDELEDHMVQEEQVLFPQVARLEALAAAGQPLPASATGSVKAPIGTMEHDHEGVARALVRLRELTGGYTPPAGACNTFRGLYHGLAEMEGALHRHIHLENNVLFPRAARLEEELASATVI